MELFGWTWASYKARLAEIREKIAEGYGYESWAAARKEIRLIRKFNRYHKIGHEYRWLASALAPLYLKENWESLVKMGCDFIRHEVAHHRKVQTVNALLEEAAAKRPAES